MFNLADHEKHIRDNASRASISLEESLKQCIYNLTVMRPHFDTFNDEMNFRTLGQQWNDLPSDVRNSQRQQLMNAFTSRPAGRRVPHE